MANIIGITGKHPSCRGFAVRPHRSPVIAYRYVDQAVYERVNTDCRDCLCRRKRQEARRIRIRRRRDVLKYGGEWCS